MKFFGALAYDALNYWEVKKVWNKSLTIGEKSENWQNRKIAYQATSDLKSGKNLKFLWSLWKKPIA